MRTRDEIYRKEASELLHIVTTYRAIRYEQALLFFPSKTEAVKTLIAKLLRQRRLYFDEGKKLLCDCPESADSPDYGMIASLWVLLDFKKTIIYHISSDFPIKITFFAQDEVYEIIYVPEEKESLINHALSAIPKDNANRLIILETKEQANRLTIPHTLAFCIVEDGVVNYYKKGATKNEQN